MKKDFNIKGSLFRWTDESAHWYETASLYTDYHTKLTDHLAKYLSPTDICCELACGTGTLARHLAPLVASYTANDSDSHATEHLLKQLTLHPQPNLTVKPGDCHTVLSGMHFDTVIFSYFGAVFHDWKFLTEITDKKLIMVVPRKNGRKKAPVQTAEAQPSATASADTGTSIPEKKRSANERSYETYASILEFLWEKEIKTESETLDLEFGQPFDDIATAREYIKHYYRLDESCIGEFLDIKLEKTPEGWYFPKKKEIGIIAADMR